MLFRSDSVSRYFGADEVGTVEDARDCASCALGGFNNGHAVSASAYENERFHGLHLVVEVASFFFVCEVRQIFFEDAHNIGFCESAVGKECFEPTDEGIDGFGVFVVCAGDYAERDETGHVGAFAFDKKLFAVFFTCGVA